MVSFDLDSKWGSTSHVARLLDRIQAPCDSGDRRGDVERRGDGSAMALAKGVLSTARYSRLGSIVPESLIAFGDWQSTRALVHSRQRPEVSTQARTGSTWLVNIDREIRCVVFRHNLRRQPRLARAVPMSQRVAGAGTKVTAMESTCASALASVTR